jgi:hypothetical protein
MAGFLHVLLAVAIITCLAFPVPLLGEYNS